MLTDMIEVASVSKQIRDLDSIISIFITLDRAFLSPVKHTTVCTTGTVRLASVPQRNSETLTMDNRRGCFNTRARRA